MVEQITLSDSAKSHFIKILEQQGDDFYAHLSLKKEGCSGYAYQLDMVNVLPEEVKLFPINDRFSLVVFEKDMPMLAGVHIDYVKDAWGGKLVYQNPKEQGRCGCGESIAF